MSAVSVESANKRDRALAVAILLIFISSVFGLLQLAVTPFLAYAMGGAFLIYLTTCVSRLAWLLPIAIAPFLALCYHALGAPLGTGVDFVPADALMFVGLVSCFLLGRKAIGDAESLVPFLAAIAIPFGAAIVSLFLCLLVRLQPRVYDFYLFRFDAALGGQASALVGRWLRNWRPLMWICVVCYEALPFAQSMLLASYLRERRPLRHFFLTMGLAGFAGCAFYQIVPVVGPIHMFGPSFVSDIERFVPLATSSAAGAVPRNGLPSLHFAWALLIFWDIKSSNRRARLLAGLFLLITALATLGTGEHYLIDLIVAIPFALSVQTGCSHKWKQMTLYATITLGWVVYLRFGMPHVEPSRTAAWLASGITVSLPTWPRLISSGAALLQRMVREQKLSAAGTHQVQLQRSR